MWDGLPWPGLSTPCEGGNSLRIKGLSPIARRSSMSAQAMLDRFIDKHPLAVMTRAILAQVVDERLDELFEQHRGRQYDGTIKFSTLALSGAGGARAAGPGRDRAGGQY